MTWSPEQDPEEQTLDTTLRGLIARGYRFIHPRDDSGDIVTIVGVRAHDDVVDVVRLDAEDDVTAMRMPADEENILEPATVLWSRSGAMQGVVADLLHLSDDACRPTAAAVSNGCWVSSGRGRSAWLARTA